MPEVTVIGGWDALRASLARLRGPTMALQQIHARHGPVVVVPKKGRGGRPGRNLVLVADLKAARGILQNPSAFANIALYAPRGPVDCAHRRLRNGILGMNGELHAHYRRLLTPSMAQASIDGIEARMRQIARTETAAWSEGQGVDLTSLAKRLSQRLSLELIFGETDIERGLAIAKEIALHMGLCGSLQAALLPLDLPGFDHRRMLRQAERAEAMLLDWVKERRGKPAGPDMMSAVLAAVDPDGKPLSDADAAAQLWTLYAASFDTTAGALAWLLLLLAQHPADADRLLAAYRTQEETDKAPPALACDIIREAMRLCPTVPFQTRHVTKATVLPETGFQLTAGDRIVISGCVINRASAFASPEAFLPERWGDPGASKAALLTFGLGPRACPGNRFATAALNAALREIWLAWRIQIEDRTKLDCYTLITHFPKRVRVSLRRQDGVFRAARVSGRACAVTPALMGRSPLSAPQPAAPLVESLA